MTASALAYIASPSGVDRSMEALRTPLGNGRVERDRRAAAFDGPNEDGSKGCEHDAPCFFRYSVVQSALRRLRSSIHEHLEAHLLLDGQHFVDEVDRHLDVALLQLLDREAVRDELFHEVARTFPLQASSTAKPPGCLIRGRKIARFPFRRTNPLIVALSRGATPRSKGRDQPPSVKPALTQVPPAAVRRGSPDESTQPMPTAV